MHILSVHRQLLDSMTTSVVMLDAQLRLRYLNPAAEMLLENSFKRVQGIHAAEWLLNHDDLIASLQQSLQTGHPFTERERPLRLPHDRELTVDMTVSPISEPGQERKLLMEITQIDRQMRIFKEEQLLTQHAAARALLRGLAHEIKNPLGGLRGAAQLLERELPDADLQEYTRIIIGEADRLQDLLDRMLGPNNLPRMRQINVHEILEHVRQLVSAEAPSAIIWVTDYDPSIPEISADRDMLIQALLNIVRNAIQALDQAGNVILRTRVLRQFTIGQTRHKLVAQIEVIDNGPGIAEDISERIFFPMVSGKDGGTGLGLSIAQALINQHGGLIECESRPGETNFSILLPVESKDDAS